MPTHFSFFAFLLFLAPFVQATELTNIAGGSSLLSSHIQTENTLLLLVYDESELRAAQDTLTIAESKQLHALILILPPKDQPLKLIAIRRAAKHFFRSDFSQSCVFFLESVPIDFEGAKALLLTADSKSPIWTSHVYPSFEELSSEPF